MLSQKTSQQIKDLQNTLKVSKHIQEIYFTANGDHYFTKHELIETLLSNKKKSTGVSYGSLKMEDVVTKVVGERKYFKKVSIATPESEIVGTMSREEVLAHKIDESTPLSTEDKSAVISLQLELKKMQEQIARMSKDKKDKPE